MQTAGARLMARARLGQEVFARGAPDGIPVVARPVYNLTLYDLLRAYATQANRGLPTALRIVPSDLYSMDDALARLGAMIGGVPDGRSLLSFLPDGAMQGLRRRSAVASTFAASLELVRSGRAELRQDGVFGPIYLRGIANQS